MKTLCFQNGEKHLKTKRLCFDMPPSGPGSTPRDFSAERQEKVERIENRVLSENGSEGTLQQLENKLQELDQVDQDLGLAEGLFDRFKQFLQTIGSNNTELPQKIADIDSFEDVIRGLKSTINERERAEVLERIDTGIENALQRANFRRRAAETITKSEDPELQAAMARTFDKVLVANLGESLDGQELLDRERYFRVEESLNEFKKLAGAPKGVNNARGIPEGIVYAHFDANPPFNNFFNYWYEIENGEPVLYCVNSNDAQVQSVRFMPDGSTKVAYEENYPEAQRQMAIRDNFTVARQYLRQGLQNQAKEQSLNLQRNFAANNRTEGSFRVEFDRLKAATQEARENRSQGNTDFVRQISDTIDRLFKDQGALAGLTGFLKEVWDNVSKWFSDAEDLDPKLPRPDTAEEAEKAKERTSLNKMDEILEHPGFDELEWGETTLASDSTKKLGKAKLVVGANAVDTSDLKINGYPANLSGLSVEVDPQTGVINLKKDINGSFNLIPGDVISFDAEYKNGAESIAEQSLRFEVKNLPSEITERDAHVESVRNNVGEITAGNNLLTLSPKRGNVVSRSIESVKVGGVDVSGLELELDGDDIKVKSGNLPLSAEIAIQLKVVDKDAQEKTISIPSITLENPPAPESKDALLEDGSNEKTLYLGNRFETSGPSAYFPLAYFSQLTRTDLIRGTNEIKDSSGNDVSSKFVLSGSTLSLKNGETLERGTYKIQTVVTENNTPTGLSSARSVTETITLHIEDGIDANEGDLIAPENRTLKIGAFNNSDPNFEEISIPMLPKRDGIEDIQVFGPGSLAGSLKIDDGKLVIQKNTTPALNWTVGDHTVDFEVTKSDGTKEQISVTLDIQNPEPPTPEEINVEDKEFKIVAINDTNRIEPIQVGTARRGITRIVTVEGGYGGTNDKLELEYNDGSIEYKEGNLDVGQSATVTVTDTAPDGSKAEKTFTITARTPEVAANAEISAEAVQMVPGSTDSILLNRGALNMKEHADLVVGRVVFPAGWQKEGDLNPTHHSLRGETDSVTNAHVDISRSGEITLKKDNNGSTFYPGDYLEISIPLEQVGDASKKETKTIRIEFEAVGVNEVTRNKETSRELSRRDRELIASINTKLESTGNPVSLTEVESGLRYINSGTKSLKLEETPDQITISRGGDILIISKNNRTRESIYETAARMVKAMAEGLNGGSYEIDGEELQRSGGGITALLPDSTLISEEMLGNIPNKNNVLQSILTFLNNEVSRNANQITDIPINANQIYEVTRTGDIVLPVGSKKDTYEYRYSLDGGQTWIRTPFTDQDSITIPASRFSSRTADATQRILIHTRDIKSVGNEAPSIVSATIRFKETYPASRARLEERGKKLVIRHLSNSNEDKEVTVEAATGLTAEIRQEGNELVVYADDSNGSQSIAKIRINEQTGVPTLENMTTVTGRQEHPFITELQADTNGDYTLRVNKRP